MLGSYLNKCEVNYPILGMPAKHTFKIWNPESQLDFFGVITIEIITDVKSTAETTIHVNEWME